MSHADVIYHNLLKEVMSNGVKRKDRTGTGTISLFVPSVSRYDLTEYFPLLTTKKMYWKGIVIELLWFLRGDTNIKYLVDNGVNIWNDDAYRYYKENGGCLSKDEYVQKIKTDVEFALKYGNLGSIYGKQWRSWGNGVDQIKQLIDSLKNDPYSRRHIVSAWNVGELEDMALPPCHTFFQCYVSTEGELSLTLYQRSADLFLGVPFNIASYSLLTLMLAQVTGLKAKEFIHVIGDAHIYLNHIEGVQEQLKRSPKVLPKVRLNPDVKDIDKFTLEDIILDNYDSHPIIKVPLSVGL